MEGVGDTFDVVPIGAWYGKGKRKGERGGRASGLSGSRGIEWMDGAGINK